MLKPVLIIGGGLIGSSILRGLHRLSPGLTLALVDQDHDTVAKARHFCPAEPALTKSLVDAAGLIILAVPMNQYTTVCRQLSTMVDKPVIITDVGSTKRGISQQMAQSLPAACQWVPGHPVAGTEQSGFDAGFAELFVDRYVILTPEPSRPAGRDSIKTVSILWQTLGASVQIMSPERHDRILAITSHLPHLLAYALVGSALEIESRSLVHDKSQSGDILPLDDILRFSAGGFRDFTRITASDPDMWRDVLLANRAALLEMLGRFTEDLLFLQRAIRYENGEQLRSWFSRARSAREKVLQFRQAGRFIPTEKKDSDV